MTYMKRWHYSSEWVKARATWCPMITLLFKGKSYPIREMRFRSESERVSVFSREKSWQTSLGRQKVVMVERTCFLSPDSAWGSSWWERGLATWPSVLKRWSPVSDIKTISTSRATRRPPSIIVPRRSRSPSRSQGAGCEWECWCCHHSSCCCRSVPSILAWLAGPAGVSCSHLHQHGTKQTPTPTPAPHHYTNTNTNTTHTPSSNHWPSN